MKRPRRATAAIVSPADPLPIDVAAPEGCGKGASDEYPQPRPRPTIPGASAAASVPQFGGIRPAWVEKLSNEEAAEAQRNLVGFFEILMGWQSSVPEKKEKNES